MANTSTPGDNVSGATPIVTNSAATAPRNADAASTVATAGKPEASSTEAETSRPAMTDIAGVRYTGYEDARSLTAADLGLDALKGEATELRWDRSNGKVVPKSELSAETVDALIKLDGFEVVES